MCVPDGTGTTPYTIFDDFSLRAPRSGELNRGLPNLDGMTAEDVKFTKFMRVLFETILTRRQDVPPLSPGEVRNVVLTSVGGYEWFIGVLKYGFPDPSCASECEWYNSVSSAYGAAYNRCLVRSYPNVDALAPAGPPTFLHLARHLVEDRYLSYIPAGQAMELFIDTGARGNMFIGVIHCRQDGCTWHSNLAEALGFRV